MNYRRNQQKGKGERGGALFNILGLKFDAHDGGG
jgi:hypothetical protein